MSDYNRDRAISDKYTEVIEAAREWTATPFAITKFAIANHDAALRELSASIQHIRNLLGVVDGLQAENERLHNLLHENKKLEADRKITQPNEWNAAIEAALIMCDSGRPLSEVRRRVAALRKEAEG